jgi:hypothetical protein
MLSPVYLGCLSVMVLRLGIVPVRSCSNEFDPEFPDNYARKLICAVTLS